MWRSHSVLMRCFIWCFHEMFYKMFYVFYSSMSSTSSTTLYTPMSCDSCQAAFLHVEYVLRDIVFCRELSPIL